MNHVTSFADFQRQHQTHSLGWVLAKLPARDLSPSEVARNLPGPETFLLESTQPSEAQRFSFLAYPPHSIHPVHTAETFLKLGQRLQQQRTAPCPHPSPWLGGLLGYLTYEAHSLWSSVPTHPLPPKLPLALFTEVRQLFIFDHLQKEVWAVTHACEYQEALDKLQKMAAHYASMPSQKHEFEFSANLPTWESNFTQSQYLQAINAIQEAIRAGETYQTNLSQCLTLPCQSSSWAVYERLKKLNPVGFAAYIHDGHNCLLSASPERLIQKHGSTLRTRPIAGTRKRNDNNAWRALQELQTCLKERGEHQMLVDLARNDLGRVAQPGSVEVASLMEIVPYSKIWHIESEVVAQVSPELDPLSIMRALFPGGTLTGVPKQRTMEIIHNLEPQARGFYSGGVGYWGYNGNLDWNIVIRSLVHCGNYAQLQAGGGIVIDADPQKEFQETLNKARPLLPALP